MSKSNSAALHGAGTTDRTATLGARERRALEERMTVLPEAPDTGVYVVVGEDSGSYTVDVESGHCTCPDARYNLPPTAHCKHEYRVRFATGIDTVPAAADRDPLLGDRVDGGPIVVASDGGQPSGADADLELESFAVGEDNRTPIVTPVTVRGEVIGRGQYASPHVVARFGFPLGSVDVHLHRSEARQLQAAIDSALTDARAELPRDGRDETDQHGLDVASIVDEYLPTLSESLQNARRAGVEADVLAEVLTTVAHEVQDGAYDPATGTDALVEDTTVSGAVEEGEADE